MTSIRHAAAHLVLPALVFADPARTTRRLLGERTTFLGKTVWGLAAGLSSGAPTAADGVGAWAEPLGGEQVVVVRFPSPRAEGEVHAAVVVTPRHRWLPFLPGQPRYFTLERAPDGTTLGEWTDEWVHLSYGPGPRASDKAGFLRAIEDVLAGRREVVDSTPRHVAEHVLLKISRAA